MVDESSEYNVHGLIPTLQVKCLLCLTLGEIETKSSNGLLSPMVQHYCHGATIFTHPTAVRTRLNLKGF